MTKINFAGDLCLHRIKTRQFYIAPDVTEILQEGDLNVANLESPLTLRDDLRPNTPVALKAKPQQNIIFNLFHIFSLANNHILDYGEGGFSDTLDFLNKNGKKHFGAGENLKAALIPLKIEINNQKIAFLGFTRWINAGRNQAGTTPGSLRKLRTIIKDLKKENYFVMLMPHWNYEYVRFPAPDNRTSAKKLIDAGADIIVGSHPHIVQGYEKYKNKYVFHSLGNFIFHSAVFKSISMIKDDPRLKLTCILTVKLKNDFDYEFKITPVYTDDDQLRLLTEEEKVLFDKNLKEISEILDNEKKYKKYFYQDAADITKQSTKMLKKLAAEQGLKNLLLTLRRVKKQDIKVKFFSCFVKKPKKAPDHKQRL